jgi:imidazolonepropionase-like amidohydrolase
MTQRTRKLAGVLASSLALLVAFVAWAIWPLLFFTRPGWGEAQLYARTSLKAPRSAVTALVGGTVIDGNGGAPLENAVVLIRDGRIAAVGPNGTVAIPSGAARVDAAGRSILPGLIDMHVHVNKGDDLHLFVAAGVTTVRDVGNFTNQVVPLARRTRAGEIVGPRIFFSGESFIHENGFAPWQRPTGSADESRAGVKERVAAGASVIKLVTDITPELVEAIVQQAHAARIPVTADILGNGSVTAERAIRLGVDGLEHVSGVPQSIHADDAPTQFSTPVSFNAMFGWIHADRRKEAALIDLMVSRGTYVVPTFVAMQSQFSADVPVRSDPAYSYISTRMRSVWTAFDRIPSFGSVADEAFLEHYAYSQRFVEKLDAAGGRIVAGSDAPTPGVVPGFSLHRELELLVHAGLTPMRAIEAATRTAAAFLGQAAELGTIEAGKVADLVVVDGRPDQRIEDSRRVRLVIQGGVPIEPADVLRLAAER